MQKAHKQLIHANKSVSRTALQLSVMWLQAKSFALTKLAQSGAPS